MMKKPIRDIMVGLLSTSVGIYMMAAPLATTVYANQSPSYSNNAEMNNHNKTYKNPQSNTGSQNPVAVVKAEVARLGLDASSDTFTLVNQTASTAVVQVIHDGTTHKVTLKRSLDNAGYDHTQDNRQKVQNQGQKQNDEKNEQGRVSNQDTAQKPGNDKKADRNVNSDHGQQYGPWTIVSVD